MKLIDEANTIHIAIEHNRGVPVAIDAELKALIIKKVPRNCRDTICHGSTIPSKISCYSKKHRDLGCDCTTAIVNGDIVMMASTKSSSNYVSRSYYRIVK